MLDTQYRMHPSISAYPNKAFYAGALADGTVYQDLDISRSGSGLVTDSSSGTVLPGFEAPMTAFLVPGKNVTFIDHDHPESAEMSSLANHGDANIVCNVVADLLYNNPVSPPDWIPFLPTPCPLFPAIPPFPPLEPDLYRGSFCEPV